MIEDGSYILKFATQKGSGKIRNARHKKLKIETNYLSQDISPQIPKLLKECESKEELRIIMQDIVGEPLCDGIYGIDEDCFHLKKLKKMIGSQEWNKNDPFTISWR